MPSFLRTLPRALSTVALLALGLGAAACSGPIRFNMDVVDDTPTADATLSDSADVSRTDVAPDRGFSCPGNGTEISGTVLTPNGEDPVPGAIVYVIQGTPAPISAGVACDSCQLPPDALGFAETRIDGRFAIPHVLDVGGTVNVVIQKGRFRRIVPVTLAGCNAVPLTAAQTRLPGTRAMGDIPRILVANNDELDNIDRVLERVGVTEFDVVDGCRNVQASGTSHNLAVPSCALGTLLADRTRLAQYNIIFAPCGSLGFHSSWQYLGEPGNATVLANLRDFLQRGGRLYTSDTSYGILARAFPEAMTFAGGTTLSALGRDPAVVGVGGPTSNPREYEGRAVDTELHDWLGARGALNANDTLTLTGFIVRWGAIDSVPATARTWVNGSVEWYDGAMTTARDAGVRPLTVSAEYRGTGAGCGRVVFTSYEVDSDAMGELTPQERVLEWLLFELGGCVAAPG